MENEPLPGGIEPQEKEYTEGEREGDKENIPGPVGPTENPVSRMKTILES